MNINTEEDIRKSRESIRKYMSFSAQSSTRHEAWIVGTSKSHKEDYHGVLYVCPKCSQEAFSVIIEGDNEYINFGFLSEFTEMSTRCQERDKTLQL